MNASSHRTHVLIATLTLVGVALSSIGCGVANPTRQRRGEAVHSGFLGDYSQIKPQEGYAAQEIFINSETNWSRYEAIYIESVSLWVNEETRELPAEDQQRITDTLYQAMHEKLSEKFRVVDRPGPNVIKARMALTQAQGAKVALNVVSTVVPQVRTASTVLGLAGDTAAIVGSASVEMEARDSITNERLAAAIDARAGTKGINRAFSKWSDVEAICDFWAEHAREFFVKRGVRQKV
jgi:hypothetical protein